MIPVFHMAHMQAFTQTFEMEGANLKLFCKGGANAKEIPILGQKIRV